MRFKSLFQDSARRSAARVAALRPLPSPLQFRVSHAGWGVGLGGVVLGLLLAGSVTTLAADFTSLCADRAAIERVYHEHRLGTKAPFAEALPPAMLESLVRQDLRKEAALQKAYGAAITPAQIAAEVQRINTTTQAPEVLAEIKAALGDDAEKFANVFAKPLLVDRELRRRFDNDDALHAPQGREVARVRTALTNAAAEFRRRQGCEIPLDAGSAGLLPASTSLTSGGPDAGAPRFIVQGVLTALPAPNHEVHPALATNELVGKLLALLRQGHSNEVNEATWQLGARPEEKPAAPTADEIEIKKRFGPDAQILSSPQAGPGQEQKTYFEDMPAELQQVLRAQLRRVGDVSAVIEMPGGFLLYLAKAQTAETLTVAVLSLPKRSFEEWLAEQNKGEQ